MKYSPVVLEGMLNKFFDEFAWNKILNFF
jgi:hypothetical protein